MFEEGIKVTKMVRFGWILHARAQFVLTRDGNIRFGLGFSGCAMESAVDIGDELVVVALKGVVANKFLGFGPCIYIFFVDVQEFPPF